MLKIGHRGIPNRFVENSLKGFEYCSEFGAGGIEYDVRTDANGNFWIMHDPSTKRTCTTNLRLSETTTNNLTEVRLRDQTPIPQLETLLKTFPNLLHNIELKTNDSAALIAFLDKILPDISLQKNEIILTSFLPENWTIFAQSDYRFGCLFDRLDQQELSKIAHLNPEFVVVNHAYAEAKIVQEIVDSNRKVWLYTVNDPEIVAYWKKTSLIDAIITDDFTIVP